MYALCVVQLAINCRYALQIQCNFHSFDVRHADMRVNIHTLLSNVLPILLSSLLDQSTHWLCQDHVVNDLCLPVVFSMHRLHQLPPE